LTLDGIAGGGRNEKNLIDQEQNVTHKIEENLIIIYLYSQINNQKA
jgi:hypothetical protein